MKHILERIADRLEASIGADVFGNPISTRGTIIAELVEVIRAELQSGESPPEKWEPKIQLSDRDLESPPVADDSAKEHRKLIHDLLEFQTEGEALMRKVEFLAHSLSVTYDREEP